ncbi:12136_t:CDS:2, partial [Gigaspora margarita]
IENLIAEQDNPSIEDIRVNPFTIQKEENKDGNKECWKGQRHNKGIQIKEGAEMQNSERDIHNKKSKEILEIYKTIQKYIRNTMEEIRTKKEEKEKILMIMIIDEEEKKVIKIANESWPSKGKVCLIALAIIIVIHKNKAEIEIEM